MYRKDILSQAKGDLRSIAPFFAARAAIRMLLYYKAVIFTGQEPYVP